MSNARKKRRRQCGSKRKHLTVSEAEEHAAHLMKKDGEVMVVYLCRWCACYHVGHRH